jgi:hypothetical protein
MKIFNHVRLIRIASPVLALALFALPATPQGKGKGGDNDPDRVITGGGLPAGWAARPDRGTADQEKVTEAGGLMHFVMGPAATFYNSASTKTGDYKYSARVTQVKPPSHPTSYGIMVGGKDLQAPNQTYTYFLVRGAGEYFISNREGATTKTQVDWTAHPAVAKQGADGKQQNVLGIQVAGADVIFSVNGTEVKRLPKVGLHVDGIVGVRIGHNFDVDVDQISR